MPRSVLEEAGGYLRSPFTPLLLFVPMGLVLAHHGEGINPLFVFLANGLAIVPLANLISNSVETLSEHLGDQWGGCLNERHIRQPGGAGDCPFGTHEWPV